MQADQHCGNTRMNTGHMADRIAVITPLELSESLFELLLIKAKIQLIGMA